MKNLFRIKSLALIAFVAILSISCDDDDPAPVAVDNSITGKAVATPNLSILVQALTKAELAGTLQGTGPFTVFAPTNAAFEKYLDDNDISSLDAISDEKLTQILLNHVVSGKVLSTQLTKGYIKTLATYGTTTSNISMYVNTDKTPGTKLLNGVANVSTADVPASNGVIHIVDAVIDVPTIVTHAQANPNFKILTSLLIAQGLVPTLAGTENSPFTVFAPVDTAFNQATLDLYGGLNSDNKSAVLKHHVVTGLNVLSSAIPTTPIPTFQGQNINIAGIVITDGSGGKSNIVVSDVDVQCGNGVIHAIDKVLLPNLAD